MLLAEKWIPGSALSKRWPTLWMLIWFLFPSTFSPRFRAFYPAKPSDRTMSRQRSTDSLGAKLRNALMPRYLEVWLHERHVGWLCEAGRATRFIATEQYLADTRRATLTLSMTLPGNEQLTQETLRNHFDP